MTKPMIAGSIYPATETGFRRMLLEANRVRQDGYELFSVVPLGESVGAVFKRSLTFRTEDENSFFE